MEAWLKGDGIQFRFPVIPESVGLDTGYSVSTTHLANGQEVSVYGGKNLKRTTLSSHFPSDKDRGYLDFYNFPSENECVKIIEKLAQASDLRYIVTETVINLPVKILNFSHSIVDGSGDIEFTIDLLEYNPPQAKAWTPPPPPDKNLNNNASDGKHHLNKVYSRNRPDVPIKKSTVKTHTVRHGDCLWDIAHKYYKDGRLYKKIKNNAENQKNYPRLKKDNVIFSGWKLVIP